MKLRTKTIVAIVPVVVLFVILANIAMTTVIEERGRGQDNAAATEAADEIETAINYSISSLHELCLDWGNWDDAWYFVQDHNQDFNDTNLNVVSVVSTNVDFILFYDSNGSIVGQRFVDLENETEATPPPHLLQLLENDTKLIYNPGITDSKSGLLACDGLCVMFSSHAITRSGLMGPSVGTVIMGRIINEHEMDKITRMTGHRVHMAYVAFDPNSTMMSISEINATSMTATWQIMDHNGLPAAVLSLDMTRSFYLASIKTTQLVIEAIIAATVALGAIFLIFVDHGILSRLNGMMKDIDHIGKGEKLDRRVRAEGKDELKTLGAEINKMLESIDRSANDISMKEKRYRAVVESTTNAIVLASAEDHKLIEVNNAFLKMSGYEPAQTALLDFDQIFRPIKPWSEVENGKELEYKGNLVRSDGQITDVELSVIPLVLDGREVKCILARDITERRKAERERELILEELTKANEKLEVTLRSIADGVITIDQYDSIMLMNRAAEELTGCRAETCMGQNLRKALPFSDEEWGLFVSTPAGGPRRVELVNTIGQTKDIEYTFTALVGANSERMGKVVAFRDVSERVRAEIAEANADRLESIGTLAGGIAHDFNNIMTSMMGEMYLLRNEIDQGGRSMKRSMDRLSEMESAMGRAKFVAQELLSLSKGGAPIQRPASIRSLLEDTARLTFTGSTIKWSLDCPDDVWAVNIDQGQMNRAFMNILINAMEASSKGSTVEIVARNIEKASSDRGPTKFVSVDFIDHGQGIPPEVLPRIFDPYFTTKEHGSGLGMTVTFSTIKRHGGELHITSDVGKGTSVNVLLPASDSQVELASQSGSVASGAGRILIMDDEEAILEVMGEVLQSLGYEVEKARDGEEAVEMYREALLEGYRFDGVIMDLTIPGGMGGKEAIKRLLEIDPKARAIVSSGYSNDPIMANCKEYGFVGVVPKPYRIEELSRVVVEAFGLRR